MKSNEEIEGSVRVVDARRATCEECGCRGVHVDTDCGEIVIECQVAATVYGSTLLMADDTGSLVCDDCCAARSDVIGG